MTAAGQSCNVHEETGPGYGLETTACVQLEMRPLQPMTAGAVISGELGRIPRRDTAESCYRADEGPLRADRAGTGRVAVRLVRESKAEEAWTMSSQWI